MEPTRAEQVAATLVRLPESGADRDGDPGVGYGVRCECKFDLANQNNNESPVYLAENRVRSPPPKNPGPRTVDMCTSGSSIGGRPRLTRSVKLGLAMREKGE
jgi:hypothetical protein